MVDEHVHLQAKEANAFGLQIHALLKAVFARQQNRSARAHNAMPGKPRALRVQCPRHLPRRSRIARRIRDVAIGCNFSARHAGYLPQHVAEHAALASVSCGTGFHLFTARFFTPGFAAPAFPVTLRMIGFFGERRATSRKPA